MEHFKEYYRLFYKTFRDLWKSDIDWKAYSIEVLSSVVGGFVFIYGNGINAVMENVSGFILSAFAFPGVLAFIYSVYKLIMTPVEIYKSQVSKSEPYDWEKIEISTKQFNILGSEGWGIEVKNKKGITLENVSVWYVGKREGQEETRLTKKERLGYINFKAEKIQFESTIIEPEKSVLFVVTEKSDIFPISHLKTENNSHLITLFTAKDIAVDVEIKARTLPYVELPPLGKRLNALVDGKVSIRPAT